MTDCLYAIAESTSAMAGGGPHMTMRYYDMIRPGPKSPREMMPEEGKKRLLAKLRG